MNPSLEWSVWFSLLQQDLTTKRERVKARTAREVVHLKIIKMLIKKKKKTFEILAFRTQTMIFNSVLQAPFGPEQAVTGSSPQWHVSW